MMRRSVRSSPTLRAVSGLLVVVAASSCSGGSADVVDANATSTTAATTSIIEVTTTTTEVTTTTSTEPSTTTTTQYALPDDLDAAVALVQLAAGDFPSTYVASTTEGDDQPLCDGVASLETAFPADANSELQLEGDHFFFSNVGAYSTPERAIEAFEYLEGAYLQCNGQTRVEDGIEILLGAISFSPPAILGTDRMTGLALDQTTPDLSVLVQTRLIASGRLLVFVGGTDPAVVQEMAETVVGRTRAEPEVASFSPSGAAAVGPGYKDPLYYSFAEGPAELLTLDLSEGARRWFTENQLERVDEVASSSCVLTQDLMPNDPPDVVERVLLTPFSEADIAAFTPEELGEIYSASNFVYCPGLHDYLQEVLATLPE